MFRRLAIPFRVTVLVLFASLIVLLAASVITVNHVKGRAAAKVAAENLLAEVSNRIIERAGRLFDPLFLMAETVPVLPEVTTAPSVLPHPLTSYLLTMLENQPEITSAYLGFDSGDFFQAITLDETRAEMRARLNAPPTTRFVLRTIVRRDDGRRVQFWRLLDERRRTVGSAIDRVADYDPRQRPWFVEAKGTGDVVITDFYLFASLPEIGTTVARRFEGSDAGVFGVDIRLSAISRFLSERRLSDHRGNPLGEIALFDRDRRLIAYSDPEVHARLSGNGTGEMPLVADLGSPVLEAVHARFAETGGAWFGYETVTVDGVRHAARIAPMPSSRTRSMFIAITVPERVFTAAMDEARTIALLWSLVLLSAFAGLAWLAARWISGPIRHLTAEVEDIRRLRLAPRPPIRSFIAEIQDLSAALATMRSSLDVFGKYVPRQLVDDMVRHSHVPEVGGERRQLTVLFTDIKDFTPLSQRLDPKVLLRRMSDYLNGMISAVEESQGVVDKFVGDAMMAYWNAPLIDENHVEHACLATLRCRAAVNALNAKWAAQGAPVFETRFGLHTGEGVVGNVGSDERMDYTIMGAAINLGSRIEGLNKHYGTRILITEAVRHGVDGRFVCRSVDRVLPKGAILPLKLYELMGMHTDDPGDADIAVTPQDLAMWERWEQVYELYRARRWDELHAEVTGFVAAYPEDELARIYLRRAEQFKADPPPSDWSGVKVFLSKKG